MRAKCRRYLLILYQIAAFVSLLMVFAYHSLASPIRVECNEGVPKPHVRDFPNNAIGNYPNKVASWDLDFEKGVYIIRIESPCRFTPYIYNKKSDGGYRHFGVTSDIKRQTDRSGRPSYYYEFKADLEKGQYQTRKWVVQVKPSPQDQKTNHTIRLITDPISCRSGVASRGCSCTVKAERMGGADKFCNLYWERRETQVNKVSFIHIYNGDNRLSNEQLKAINWTSYTMLPCRDAIARAQKMCDAECRR